jgi:hypothetical protein
LDGINTINGIGRPTEFRQEDMKDRRGKRKAGGKFDGTPAEGRNGRTELGKKGREGLLNEELYDYGKKCCRG